MKEIRANPDKNHFQPVHHRRCHNDGEKTPGHRRSHRRHAPYRGLDTGVGVSGEQGQSERLAGIQPGSIIRFITDPVVLFDSICLLQKASYLANGSRRKLRGLVGGCGHPSVAVEMMCSNRVGNLV